MSGRGPGPLRALHLRLRAEAHGLVPMRLLHDALQPLECTAQDEEHVGGVDLDEVLVGVLATALRWHVGDGALQDLEEALLNALTETSRVMDGLSALRAILSISSM